LNYFLALYDEIHRLPASVKVVLISKMSEGFWENCNYSIQAVSEFIYA